jgi:hypothetical protein
MSSELPCLIFLTAAYPLYRAWQANRRTSLTHAVHWAVAAWAAWEIGICLGGRSPAGTMTLYAALCVTGCAGVAVLGARRPLAGPWSFVVLGLLAVLLLPVAEAAVLGHPLRLESFRAVFLAATLAVGVLNYVPTRLGWAAILLALGCAYEMFRSVTPTDPAAPALRPVGTAEWLVLVPWVAYASMRLRTPSPSEFDRIWLDFRDRFGLVWGQRLREQFNRSAFHAGWPVVLRWRGLRLTPGSALPEPGVQREMVATLGMLMKRFGPNEGGT